MTSTATNPVTKLPTAQLFNANSPYVDYVMDCSINTVGAIPSIIIHIRHLSVDRSP